jgi:hypothetical protein
MHKCQKLRAKTQDLHTPKNVKGSICAKNLKKVSTLDFQPFSRPGTGPNERTERVCWEGRGTGRAREIFDPTRPAFAEQRGTNVSGFRFDRHD